MKKVFLCVILLSFAVMCNQNVEAVTINDSQDMPSNALSGADVYNLLPPFAEISKMTLDNIDVTGYAYVEYTENLMKIMLYDYNLVSVSPGAMVSIAINFKNIKDDRFYSDDVNFYALAETGGAAPGILYSQYSSSETSVHYSVDRIWGGEPYLLTSGFYLNQNGTPLKVEILLPIYINE